MLEPTLGTELNDAIELASWKSLVKGNPGLAHTIKQMVQIGGIPSEIQRAARKAGASLMLTATIGNAATWLKNHQKR